MGDSAVPGGGMSVLPGGWETLGGGVSAQSYLRVAGAGPSSFLTSGRAFWAARVLISPCAQTQAYQELLCVQCASSRQVIGAGIFFFFFFPQYQLIRPNGFHGCSNKAQKKTCQFSESPRRQQRAPTPFQEYRTHSAVPTPGSHALEKEGQISLKMPASKGLLTEPKKS